LRTRTHTYAYTNTHARTHALTHIHTQPHTRAHSHAHTQVNNFKEDLQKLYKRTGLKGEGIMFLFTDSQIVDERMLVYVNDLLSSGEIPDLFPQVCYCMCVSLCDCVNAHLSVKSHLCMSARFCVCVFV
jgi:hypothetical protein